MSRQYSQPPGVALGQPSANVQDKLFSSENRHMLYGLLTKDLAKKGYTLTGETTDQLEGFLDHYMGEVYQVQGPKSLQFLNKEILLVTATEFAGHLKKRAAAPAPVAKKAVAAPAVAAPVVVAAKATGKPGPAIREDDEMGTPVAAAGPANEFLFMDTGSRFDALQKDRQMAGKKPVPEMPEFKIDFTDDGPSPMELYERAKKARERDGLLMDTPAPKKVDVLVPAETRPARVVVSGEDYQDAREKGIAIASPNLVPVLEDGQKILSQQVVIKDEDVKSYKETETNLVVYSVDRDWYNNVTGTDNRYNFNVNFDPANNKQGFGLSPAANIKFRNIVRIEFVKAIIPAEGLDAIVVQDTSGATPTYDVTNATNALSFPYLTVRVDEFRGNNYGTDNNLDNSFAVLQYDANWSAGASGTNAYKGYYAFIPKNLKAQRVWAPTPLATLQRLSIRLERPDGTLVQSSLDTNSVADVVGSNEAAAMTTTYYTAAGAARYIFVQTSQWFSQFAVQRGDRVLFQQFAATNATYPAAALEMGTYMNREAGLVVVDIAYDAGGGVITAGANSVGYANYIVFEVNMEDPTTGSTAVNPFGGSTVEHNGLLAGSTTYAGKLINLNRQTQFVFRVITRELDGATRLRPDNTN